MRSARERVRYQQHERYIGKEKKEKKRREKRKGGEGGERRERREIGSKRKRGLSVKIIARDRDRIPSHRVSPCDLMNWKRAEEMREASEREKPLKRKRRREEKNLRYHSKIQTKRILFSLSFILTGTYSQWGPLMPRQPPAWPLSLAHHTLSLLSLSSPRSP